MSNNFKKKQEQERRKFKSWENPQVKDRYVRFAHNTLHNENYQNLSVYAKVLYMYMKDWAYGCKEFVEKSNNGGNGSFDYSVRFAKSVLNCSIQKASDTIHELEQKGFIERQNNSKCSRQTSEWKFIDRWHKGYMV